MGGEELGEDGETQTGERWDSHNERAGEQESWSRSLCTMAAPALAGCLTLLVVSFHRQGSLYVFAWQWDLGLN